MNRYAESIQRDFAGWDIALLYLTLDGDQPSNPRWRTFTHRHVLAMIEEGILELRSGTPLAVRMFIEHYQQLLRDIYNGRVAIPRRPEPVQQSEFEAAVHELSIDQVADEKPAGWDKFDALMRKIVSVPKSEVARLMAERKAANIERRRGKNKPS